MSNPTGKGGAKKGEPSRNPHGLSKEAKAERDLVNALLLTPARDQVWLSAYDAALTAGVAPIILDYAHRRLGKPPESINVTDDRSNELLEMLKAVPPEDVLKFLDATKDEK